MYQAIVTKFIGPTDFRGSRVKARAAAGSITISYDHSLSVEENHCLAAESLARKLCWDGAFISGEAPDSSGYIFVCIHSDSWRGYSFCIPKSVSRLIEDSIAAGTAGKRYDEGWPVELKEFHRAAGQAPGGTMNEWQDISTAPKDGTEVDMWGVMKFKDGGECHWFGAQIRWKNGGWRDSENDPIEDGWASVILLTHFRPHVPIIGPHGEEPGDWFDAHPATESPHDA